MKIYLIFISNEDEFQKGINILKEMQYYGFNFPLVFIFG
jgi:hypothetical protein